MATLNTPISDLSSQTEPTKLDLNLGTADDKTCLSGAPISFAKVPDLRALAVANGIDPLRLLIDSEAFRLGLLAPNAYDADPTATPGGAQATAALDVDDDVTGGAGSEYTIANGDKIQLMPNALYGGVQFVTSLGAQPTKSTVPGQVLVGATNAATLLNLQSYIDGAAGSGVTYWHNANASPDDVLETTAVTSTKLSFRAKAYGTGGNSYQAYLLSGGWSNASLGTQGETVGTVGYMSGGTDGSGTTPAAGSYRYAYTYYRAKDLAESGLSDTATAVNGNPGDIDLSTIKVGTDADYDFKRIYRTLVSGEEFFFLDEVAAATTVYTDTKADEAIQLYGAIPFDVAAHRTYPGGHIPKYRVLASWKGRLWGGGALPAADYNLGTCVVTKDSATAVLTADVCFANTLWEGRRFRVTNNDDTEVYRIISVDMTASPQEFDIDRPYSNASKGPAQFEIVDDRDPTDIGCSEPGLPNQWPEDNQLTGIQSEDPEGIVGVVPFGDSLFWFCRDGIWRLTGDSVTSWQLTKVVDGVGAVHQPITAAGGMFWLGVDGIYAWAGSGAPQRISSPATQGDRVTGIDGTIDRINHAHAHLTHALYDPEDRTVKFFVPIDSAVSPSHAISLDLATGGTFSLDEGAFSASGLVADNNGDRVPLLGDIHGYVFQGGTAVGSPVDYHFASAKNQDTLAIPTKDAVEGDFTDADSRTRFRVQKRGVMHKLKMAFFVTGDGGFGFETVQAISSATINTITVSGTPFPTSGNGLDGVPVWIVRDTGAVEMAKVASNTSSVLTLTTDLVYTPDSNDQIVVGGVFADMETGRWDLGETRRDKSLYDVWVTHAPDTAAILGYTLAIRSAQDLDI